MRRKEKVVHSSLVVFLLTCLLGSSAFASIGIKEMQFSFRNLNYYSSQALGFSQGTSLSADVAIPTGPGTVDYAYAISNAVVTLSTMPLTNGVGTNTGTFSSPATLTVTGNLIKKSTSADLTGNVTLFVATMDSSSMVMTEALSKFATGSALFTPTGGALFTGVADGSITLVLPEFTMGLWGRGVTVLFGAANSMTPTTASVQITTNAVPEPLTISLLAAGMLALSRKRKTN